MASPREQIEVELGRLRRELQQVETPDPIDVATVEALASNEVQELLIPILEEGAHLTSVILESAGVVPGVVQLTFDCAWIPGTSHLSHAPAISALVEISPPRVLKAAKVVAPASPPGVRFAAPLGEVPPALRNMRIPSGTEAHEFQTQSLSSVNKWLEETGLQGRIRREDVRMLGLTTGTKCTSLLCFEKTADDDDDLEMRLR
jgi:hypothetical protein